MASLYSNASKPSIYASLPEVTVGYDNAQFIVPAGSTTANVQIQQCVTYAAAVGLPYRILPGTFKIAAVIDHPTLQRGKGAGQEKTIIDTNGNNITAFQFLGNNGSGEAGYEAYQGLSDLTIKGNANGSHSANYGIITKYVRDFVIENVTFDQCYYSIACVDAIYGMFRKCIIKNSREHGVRIFSLDADGSCHNLTWENCTFDTNFGSGQLFYGFRNNASTGVTCNLPQDITLKGCVFKNSIQASVRYEGRRLTIDNCYSYNPGFHNYRISSDGLGGEDCVIINSYGEGSTQNGMYFDNDFQTIKNLKVENNTIKNSAQHGIQMQGAIDYKFDGNTIINSGYGSGGTSFDAFSINAAAAGRSFLNLTLRNNVAYDTQGTKTQGYGIDYNAPSGGSTIANIVLENNNFTNNAVGEYNPALDTYITRLVKTDGSLRTRSGQSVKIRVVTAAGAVTMTNADYIVEINKTVGAATTVNLPSSPLSGDTYVIKDGKGDAAANNITVTPAAGNIDGAATYVMNVNKQAITVYYNGTQWAVI